MLPAMTNKQQLVAWDFKMYKELWVTKNHPQESCQSPLKRPHHNKQVIKVDDFNQNNLWCIMFCTYACGKISHSKNLRLRFLWWWWLDTRVLPDDTLLVPRDGGSRIHRYIGNHLTYGVNQKHHNLW